MTASPNPMKHFEGKLTVKPYSVILEDENGDTFAGALKLCPQEEGHQNALRLASCWNAMEGMEPGELEGVLEAAHKMVELSQFDSGPLGWHGNQLEQALRRLRKEGV